MTIFRTLNFKNFLGTGDKEVTIQLDQHFSTLVVGSNGSGKSTMLDALSFVLFNKPHRNICKPQLINSINQKNCVVTVIFSIGDVKYKVVRGMRPGIFEIWQDGILINQESHSRDYQRLLETNILKLNHKSFHQVVVLGSSNFVPFMQLNPGNRRSVIEDLLDISVFTKMNILLKEGAARLKDSIRDSETQLNLIKEKLVIQNKHLASLREMNLQTDKKTQEEISALSAEVVALTEDNSRIISRYDAEYGVANTKSDSSQVTLSNLIGFENQIKANIKKTVAESKFYEDNDVCPTCSQEIGEVIKTHKRGECKSAAAELQSGFIKLQDKLAETRMALTESSNALSEIAIMQSQIRANTVLISNIERQILSLRSRINCKNSSKVDTSIMQSELDTLRSDRERMQDFKSNQMEEATYNGIISELLKDTGIKTKIIRQYLPIMNRLINQHLQTLDFFVSFHLDDNFNETIRSRHRDDFSYSSFSEGEKSRIDLALLFSWRQIAKMKNSANTNLLMLDEVYDGSLDSDGADNLMKILNSLGKDTNVFVISHKQDLLEAKFEHKIEFAKSKNFSVIV